MIHADERLTDPGGLFEAMIVAAARAGAPA
jgi:hypothetical protein